MYFGTTELRNGGSAEDACKLRLWYHKTFPLTWLRAAVSSSMKIEALDTLTKPNALAQEALYVARALGGEKKNVRGACWSGPYLSFAWRSSAAAVRRVSRELVGQAARQAVLNFARTLSDKEGLVRHLSGEPFSGASQSRQKIPETMRRTSSGTRGNKMRKRKRRVDPTFAGSSRERRSHRGVNPKARRAAEDKRRQPKRRKRRTT